VFLFEQTKNRLSIKSCANSFLDRNLMSSVEFLNELRFLIQFFAKRGAPDIRASLLMDPKIVSIYFLLNLHVRLLRKTSRGPRAGKSKVTDLTFVDERNTPAKSASRGDFLFPSRLVKLSLAVVAARGRRGTCQARNPNDDVIFHFYSDGIFREVIALLHFKLS
jgi:hypothetical protein